MTKNELVILTSAGQIPISIDDLLQNIYGEIMVRTNEKHISLRQMIETDFTPNDIREMMGEEE